VALGGLSSPTPSVALPLLILFVTKLINRRKEKYKFEFQQFHFLKLNLILKIKTSIKKL
jgi:hypothetical protein